MRDSQRSTTTVAVRLRKTSMHPTRARPVFVTTRRAFGRVFALSALAVAGLGGCAPRAEGASAVDMSAVKSDLETVAAARILFAHQSVGRNVMEGVRLLSTQFNVPIRIEQIALDKPVPAGQGIFHAYIGENGNGAAKIDAFKRLVLESKAPYDAAALKFCYADLASDAQERERVLDRYSAAVSVLQTQRPEVRLVHATSPLRTVPSGWRSTLNRWLGRDSEEKIEAADNAVRNDYNVALLKRYAGQPTFDIATAESTRPDGSRARFSIGEALYFELAPEYTTDGGHLNADGQRAAAAAFLHSMASALKQGKPRDAS